ncbi:MAG: AAA family ATPase [Methylococcales bacterium]
MALSELSNDDRKQTNLGRAGRENINTHKSLLSPARKQKLELLASLIKTQQQSLIVCGPEGIGKTTILKRLAKSNNTRQLWKYVECNVSLRFSMLVMHLSSVLSVSKERSSTNTLSKRAQKLASQLNKIAKNGHTVVFVLDNAGRLQAGVLTKFLAFARQCQGLQVILAITPDELFIKRSTDNAIDDCYVVEIPPLTKQETENFMLNALQENKQHLEFETIPENFTDEIYRESQGNPGVILQGISKMAPQSQSLSGEHKFNSLLWLALLGFIGLSIWGGLSYLGRLDNNSADNNYVDLNNAPPPLVGSNQSSKQTQAPKAAKTDNKLKATAETGGTVGETPDYSTSSVLPTTEDILNSTLANDAVSLSDYSAETESNVESEKKVKASFKPIQQKARSNDITERRPIVSVPKKQAAALAIKEASKIGTVIDQPANIEKIPTKQEKQEQFQGVHGPDWVLSQNKDSFTLQLMASSDKESMIRYINQSSELHDQSAYYKMKLKGRNWYGLIYGVYPTIAAARQAIKQLPKSLGKPYMLPINEVQSRIQDYQ